MEYLPCFLVFWFFVTNLSLQHKRKIYNCQYVPVLYRSDRCSTVLARLLLKLPTSHVEAIAFTGNGSSRGKR